MARTVAYELSGSRIRVLELAARPKPEWNERVTIEIEERFYRLRRVEERQDGTWWVHAHVLDEAPSNEIIRGLVRYVPPEPRGLRSSSPPPSAGWR